MTEAERDAFRQRLAEINEEIRMAREVQGHTNDCDDIREEARDIRKALNGAAT